MGRIRGVREINLAVQLLTSLLIIEYHVLEQLWDQQSCDNDPLFCNFFVLERPSMGSPTVKSSEPPCDQPRDKSRGPDPLQGLRGLAALHVLFYHFFMDYAK